MELITEDLIPLNPIVKEFLDLPAGIKKNILYNNNTSYQQLFIYCNVAYKDNNMYFSYMTYRIRPAKNNYFLKINSKEGFTLENMKKLKIWFGANINKMGGLTLLFTNHFQYQWMTTTEIFFLTKGLLEKILTKKITNRTEFYQQWLKAQRIKASGKLLEKVLYSDETALHSHQLIKNIVLKASMVMTNLDAFLTRLAKSGTVLYQFQDSINQALLLETKINPLWSDARLNQEHTLMTREIMQHELDLMKNESVKNIDHILPLITNPHFKLLTDRKEVFQEGKEMDHCIHTNYWSSIQNGSILVFRVNYRGESGTLTLQKESMRQRHVYRYYMFNGKRNCQMSPEIKEYAQDFLRYLNDQLSTIEIPELGLLTERDPLPF